MGIRQHTALGRLVASAALWAFCAFASAEAQAFCGFFVAQADATLFNNASQVVLVHDAGKSVLTMVNNYRGEPRGFALVVPVPIVLQKELVRVTEMKVVDHLDAFSAPRLAEYFDPDPCMVRMMAKREADSAPKAGMMADAPSARAKDLGVTVEATYTVGEYDIVILGAKESDGLEIWLRQNGYNIPRGASAALAPYVRSGLKFFVAKVNLKEQAKTGFNTLRPLQFAFPDARFMLPIRLGMLNADGPQDLITYVITKQHRAEVTNYRNPRLSSDQDVPPFIKGDFKSFYRDMFSNSVKKENGRAVFTEYAWNMGWCDPCAADPLAADELRKLGVWWVGSDGGGGGAKAGAQQAFVTRLHARYTPDTFPEDLLLKVTTDSSNYQARYVIRHPFLGGQWCDAMGPYLKAIKERQEREVQNLVVLTGWDPGGIRSRLAPLPTAPGQPSSVDQGWMDQMKDLFKNK